MDNEAQTPATDFWSAAYKTILGLCETLALLFCVAIWGGPVQRQAHRWVAYLLFGCWPHVRDSRADAGLSSNSAVVFQESKRNAFAYCDRPPCVACDPSGSIWYGTGPELYLRATGSVPIVSTAPTAAQLSVENAATAQLRAERDNAFAQRDDALAKLATMTKERDEQKQMIAALQAKNYFCDFSQNTDKTPTASIPEPITWSNRLLFYSGGDKTIKYIVLYGTNNGYAPQQLKTATLSSDITGETRSFLIEVPTHRIDADQIDLGDINPVPPGAEIELIMEWKPAIAVSDFMSQWGKAQLEISYGGVIHKMTFDQENMRSSLAQDIVGADVVVGVPRVTPKAP